MPFFLSTAFAVQDGPSFLDQLTDGVLAEPSILDLGLNLLLALAFGQILSWHYQRFARVLSNRRKFARLFVFITATTLLMISVVKTSLALSLGLVGALSIIRFRTPIKEPEDLAYLFLAIAVGIGLGADQRLATSIVFVVILGFLALQHVAGPRQSALRTVLHISSPSSGEEEGRGQLDELLPAIEQHCSRVDLRRVDWSGGEFHASLWIEIPGRDGISRMVQGIQNVLPSASVSLVERDSLE